MRHVRPHLVSAARLALGATLIAVPLATLRAQSPAQRALASWQQLAAPTGHEERALSALATALPGWQRDAVGNLVLRRGSGSPRRVIACGLDRPGYTVSQITDDGLLRVHRVGGGGHALFDQAHEAQQVNVHTARGLVPGVAAVANGHFAPQHRGDTAIVTADDLWIDVGAASRAEVAALGIRLLDPLDRRVPAWPYAGGVAGGGVGARAGCAAIAAVSRGTVARGETIYLMTAQSVFGWPTLGASIARLGGVDEVTDPSTPSGVRLALPPEAMPVNIDNTAVDVAPLNRFDGFAPSAPALVVMPNGISGVGLVCLACALLELRSLARVAFTRTPRP